MTRRNLIIAAAAVAALASPLVAGDETVEKATRYRAIATESAEPVQLPAAVTNDVTDVEASVQIEEFGASVENDSSAQIDELGGSCCFGWNQNSEQVDELGCCFGWNQNAAEVEELGSSVESGTTDQVDELGGSCCFQWNNNAAEVEELGSSIESENTDQIEELGCCYYWNQNTAEIED